MTTQRLIKRGTSSHEAKSLIAARNREAAPIVEELFNSAHRIDPEEFVDDMAILVDLDALGIRGEKVVRFYRIVCDGDIAALVAVLHAWHQCLEDVTKDEICRAIERGQRLDLETITEAVRAEASSRNPAA